MAAGYIQSPPVNPTTGRASPIALNVAILRPISGGYIAFDDASDAIGHPTSEIASGIYRDNVSAAGFMAGIRS